MEGIKRGVLEQLAIGDGVQRTAPTQHQIAGNPLDPESRQELIHRLHEELLSGMCEVGNCLGGGVDGSSETL